MPASTSIRHLWQRWLRRPAHISDAVWAATITAAPFLAGLKPGEKAGLRVLADAFLRTKSFEGAAGLDVTESMRAGIAAQACLLVLELGLDWYRGWSGIILYPGAFRVEHRYTDPAGVEHHSSEVRAGEAWERGPIVLSWEDAAAQPARPAGNTSNVILHEFAHKLDMLDGHANGCPPLHAGMNADSWARDFSEAYDHLERRLAMGAGSVLDPYAASDPAEFFAVCSEAFFIRPVEVRQEFPRIYDQLRRFYLQDPAQRLPVVP